MSIPYVIEPNEKGDERVYDLYSRLLKDRIVFIKGTIKSEMADAVVAQLLFLETRDDDTDINMYINSVGGEVSAMYAMFDVMQYIKPDIRTIGMGTCASAASFLLAAGTKGKRMALPNTDVMIHELSTGHQGKYNDMRVYQKHIDKMYDNMARNYVNFTGQSLKKIKRDMERDFHMSAEEAVEYGLIDKVIETR